MRENQRERGERESRERTPDLEREGRKRKGERIRENEN